MVKFKPFFDAAVVVESFDPAAVDAPNAVTFGWDFFVIEPYFVVPISIDDEILVDFFGIFLVWLVLWLVEYAELTQIELLNGLLAPFFTNF